MPDKIGRFQLYSDTSKYATGSALYQIQNGKPKLIAYTRDCQRQHAIIPSQIRNVWFGNKHCEFCTSTEKSGCSSSSVQ